MRGPAEEGRGEEDAVGHGIFQMDGRVCWAGVAERSRLGWQQVKVGRRGKGPSSRGPPPRACVCVCGSDCVGVFVWDRDLLDRSETERMMGRPAPPRPKQIESDILRT